MRKRRVRGLWNEEVKLDATKGPMEARDKSLT